MDSGLVYRTHGTLCESDGEPYVFDCATKIMFDLRQCAPFDDRMAWPTQWPRTTCLSSIDPCLRRQLTNLCT